MIPITPKKDAQVHNFIPMGIEGMTTSYRLNRTTQRSCTLPGAMCLISRNGTGFKLTSFTTAVQVKTSSITHNFQTIFAYTCKSYIF